MLDLLRSLAEQQTQAGAKAVFTDLAAYVERGNPLWCAFERHPMCFSSSFVYSLKAVEEHNALPSMLGPLIDQMEFMHRLRFRVSGMALTIVLSFLFLFPQFYILGQFILPALDEGSRPWFSEAIIPASDFAQLFSSELLLGAFGTVVVFLVYRYIRITTQRSAFHRHMLRVPVLGNHWRNLNAIVFVRGLALYLRAGISLEDALDKIPLSSQTSP